jgi:GTP-binding protein HflX
LVAAFRATLEEVAEADVIVHVRDASHSDSDAQREDVHRVLGEMGLGAAVDAGMVELLNKIDLIAPERRDVLINQAARAPAPVVPLSAISGEGCKQLLAVLDGVATGAWLYEHGRVIERRDGETGIALKVSLAVANLARFERLRRRERHPGEGA